MKTAALTKASKAAGAKKSASAKKAPAKGTTSKKATTKKIVPTKSPYDAYSEQDTADKLILTYLASEHGFPKPESLDYQAQHHLVTEEGKSGRYDGIYLS